jgi:S1-C subfamily serine protease
MHLLWALFIAAHTFAAPALDSKKLLSECYDGNMGSACLQLSEKLNNGKSATDRERAKLARHRACTLGEVKACTAGEAPAAAKPATEKADTSETMKIKRANVEGELANLPALLQGARLEGRKQGFEFVQLEPGTAYEKLGFRIGDILLEINGHALESSSQAMELFVLLRSESDFKVKLKRDGKVIERKYEIKD